MTRANLASMLISKRPRIWYLAVAGAETVRGAMGNLQELQRRITTDRIQGAIFDFRKLDGYDPQQDWEGFLQGLAVYVPHGLPLAWLAHTHGANAAQRLARAAQKSGALSQYCVNWEAALMTVGLPQNFEDPLPDILKPPEEDVFYLD
ncbi:hypothetical protein ACFELO_02850 [Oceanicaulis sp. LC35]|uniref:hypothetical protein n=1 Tax=Oceanicaulis sp. LC35 TaxID=3349635 RepID=UPI003F84C652